MTSRTRRVVIALLAVLAIAGVSTTLIMGKSNSVKVVTLSTDRAPSVVSAIPQKILNTQVIATPIPKNPSPISTPTPPTASNHKMTTAVAPAKTLLAPASKVTVPRGTTVTTPTHSGQQTLTVRTNRVKISVPSSSVASGTLVTSGWKPSDSLPVQGMIPDPSTSTAPVVADWSGYIAPSISWDGWISCVRSSEKTLASNGILTYIWTLTGRVEVTRGNYTLFVPETNQTRRMTPTDTLFLYPIHEIASDVMNRVSDPHQANIVANITAMPMNRDVSHSWDTRVTAFNEAITYSQGSCP